MEFFKPIVPSDKQHPNFRSVSDQGIYLAEQREFTRWAKGFVDRDGKFVHEFQTTFNSSFWEIYLHAAFKELGLTHDYSFESPDFSLAGKQSFVAEAVTASNAEGYRPEWDHLELDDFPDVDIQNLLANASVRLANSISAKHEKYLKRYSEQEHVKGKPFVLCVAPFEQPLFFSQNDNACLLYTSPSPRDQRGSRMPSSA